MSDRKTARNEEQQDDDPERTGSIGRRRLLQIAGVGIAGGALATGVALASDHELPHTIVFDGTNTQATAEYAFGVTGAVQPDADEAALEDEDTIDGEAVSGQVTGDRDAYRFEGNLTHLDVDGAVDVSISYADETAGVDRLEIVSPANASVEYTFTVAGEVEPVLDNGSNSAEPDEDRTWETDGGPSVVSGVTGGGDGDTFDLAAGVTSFGPIEGEFTLLLNGEAVSAAELVDRDLDGSSGDPGDGSDGSDDESDEPEEPGERTIEIVSPSNGSVEYTFTTSGPIEMVEKPEDDGAEEENDDVTENGDGTWTATGTSGLGYDDTYTMEGFVRTFEITSGDADLYVDGEPTTPDELTSA